MSNKSRSHWTFQLRTNVRFWAAIIAASASLISAVPASADLHTSATQHVTGAIDYQQWLARSRAPTPQVVIEVIDAPCPLITAYPAPACTGPGEPIYITPGTGRRAAFFHELGHQFDYVALDDSEQARFMEIAGVVGPWRDPALLHSSPHELFAEVYRQCALSRRDHGRWRPPVQEAPVRVSVERGLTNRTLAALCGLIDDAA